jgi:hypothetical protein
MQLGKPKVKPIFGTTMMVPHRPQRKTHKQQQLIAVGLSNLSYSSEIKHLLETDFDYVFVYTHDNATCQLPAPDSLEKSPTFLWKLVGPIGKLLFNLM